MREVESEEEEEGNIGNRVGDVRERIDGIEGEKYGEMIFFEKQWWFGGVYL